MPRKLRKIYIVLICGLLMPLSNAHAELEFDPAENSTPGTDLTSITRVTFLSGGQDPLSIALNLINLSLSFLGTISLVLMLYAGILWFRAGSNEDDITKAKQVIIGSVIGLMITMGSYAISLLVYNLLYEVTAVPATEEDDTDIYGTPTLVQ